MKHDSEVKIFYSDRYGYISLPTLCGAVNLLNETRYSMFIYHLVTSPWRYSTWKYSLGESLLLAKTKDYTLLYIVLGRLNDKLFSGVGVLSIFRWLHYSVEWAIISCWP